MPRGKTPKKGPDPLRAALAPFEFPHPPGAGLCFDAEGDRAFERGYPHLRWLSEERIAPKKIDDIVVDALDAVDPVFRVTVPREVARRFLLGYRVGPLLHLDPKDPKKNVELRDERLALLRSDRAIDVALLEETFEQPHAWGMGDTYARWRWPKVLYLYEAFLGTEPVARALVQHLVRSAKDFPRWGFAGEDPERDNAAHHYLAAALPWLLLRVEPSVAAQLRGTLARCPAPDSAGPREPRAYLALLRWLSAPAAEPPPFGLGLEAVDGIGLREAAESSAQEFLWNVGRVAWLLGTDALAAPLPIGGHDLPRMVDAAAPLRDPAVVRLMARIASQRAGKKAAGDWLRKHATYARPIIEALAALPDPKEAKPARAALDLLGGGPVVEPAPVTEDDLEAEIARIFETLGAALRASKRKERQVAAIRDAYEAYTEARAAAGDPIPEAYFTHRFGDFDLGEWGELAASSI